MCAGFTSKTQVDIISLSRIFVPYFYCVQSSDMYRRVADSCCNLFFRTMVAYRFLSLVFLFLPSPFLFIRKGPLEADLLPPQS